MSDPTAPVSPPPASPAPVRGWLGRTALFVLPFLLTLAGLRLGLHTAVANKIARNVVRTQDVLLALLVAWLVFVVGSLWGTRPHDEPAGLRLRERAPVFGLLLVVFLTPLLLWFVGEWPGHLRSDMLQSVAVSSRHEVDPWLSTLWGLYAGAVHRITGNFTLLSVLNILLLSWVLADVFSLLLRLGLPRWGAVPFVLLLVTSVPLGLLAINLSHDILNGFLKIALVATLLRVLVRGRLSGRPGARPGTLVLLGALVLATALLRGENIVLLVYVPALLLLTRQARPLAVGLLVLALVAGHLTFRRALEPMLTGPWLNNSDFRNRYQLTLLLNPLGFMAMNHAYSPTPEQDREVVSRAVSWECLVERTLIWEPPCYWTDLRSPLTDENLAGVKRVFVRTALDNPGLFLANRVAVFAGNLGVAPQVIPPFIPEREQADPAQLYRPHAEVMAREGLVPPPPNALSRLTHAVRDGSYPREGLRSARAVLWTSLPAFLLLVGLLVTWRRNPMCAALAGVLAVPLGPFFLAAPASHITYLTDLWVFGYLAVPLLLFERRVLGARAVSAREQGAA